jgi:hypothetical protein
MIENKFYDMKKTDLRSGLDYAQQVLQPTLRLIQLQMDVTTGSGATMAAPSRQKEKKAA